MKKSILCLAFFATASQTFAGGQCFLYPVCNNGKVSQFGLPSTMDQNGNCQQVSWNQIYNSDAMKFCNQNGGIGLNGQIVTEIPSSQNSLDWQKVQNGYNIQCGAITVSCGDSHNTQSSQINLQFANEDNKCAIPMVGSNSMQEAISSCNQAGGSINSFSAVTQVQNSGGGGQGGGGGGQGGGGGGQGGGGGHQILPTLQLNACAEGYRKCSNQCSTQNTIPPTNTTSAKVY